MTQHAAQKVLVVGATGVVGRQLVPQLVAAGHQVVATSRQASERTDGAVTWRRLDLLDAPAARRLVAEERPDAIIHQATALSRIGNNLRRFDSYFATTNRLRTAGTATLIEAAEANGRARLIVQSFCGWPAARGRRPDQDRGRPARSRPTEGGTPNAGRDQGTGAAGHRLRQRCGAALRRPVRTRTRRSIPAVRSSRPSARAGCPRSGTAAGSGPSCTPLMRPRRPSRHSNRGRRASTTSWTTSRRPVAVWLPELARLLGAPKPRRVPVWVGWLIGGDALVRMMTELRGSSNAKAKAELGWMLRFPSWRQGFAARAGTRRRMASPSRP